MDLEDELSRMLSDSTAGLATPVHTIIAEATRRGRVLRRRRRLGITATVLVVAGLAGGGALMGLPGPPRQPTARATDQPLTVADTSPEPSASPALSSDTLFNLLSGSLPDTASLTDDRAATTVSNEFETKYGFLASIDENRSSFSSVRVQLSSRGTVDDPLGCPGPSHDPAHLADADSPGCELSKLSDGGTLRVEIGGADAQGVYAYQLTAVHRDGTTLEITAWNGLYRPPDQGGPERTREHPPFGIGFWKGVAMSEKWDYPLAPTPG